jgi:hypothetical protein
LLALKGFDVDWEAVRHLESPTGEETVDGKAVIGPGSCFCHGSR